MAKVVSQNERGVFTLLHNPYQQEFLKALKRKDAKGLWHIFRRFAIIAGRRGGKTFIGGVAAAEMASRYPLGWCVAPTYGDLHDYVIPAVMQVIPAKWIPKGGWSAEFNMLTLVNGAKIAFRSAEDPERMRGPGVYWSWWDEARKIKKLSWDTFEPATTEHRAPVWFTTSPNGYDWVYHEVYKRAMPGPYQRPGYWACRYKTTDNPKIPRAEIEEKRLTMDPSWFAQEYEAEFVRFEGAIYGDTMPGCVLHDPEAIRRALPWYPNPDPSWPLIVGLDPGADHPFAMVGILATPQGLVPWVEYSKRLSAYGTHAENIKLEVRGTGQREVRWVMDATQAQAFIELATHGISATAAQNSVLLGIQRVQSWLRVKRLFLLPARTPRLVEQMETYHWHDRQDESEERKTERPYKLDDDLCDALRYGVMSWPELPMVTLAPEGRDMRTIPEELRWAWEREQRIAKGASRDAWDSLRPMDGFFDNGATDTEGEGFDVGLFYQ